MNFFTETKNLSKIYRIDFWKKKDRVSDDLISSGAEFKISRIAFSFVVFLFLFESGVFEVGYSDYSIYLFDTQTLPDSFLIFILEGISIYLLFRFVVFALSSGWLYKVICFAVFTFALFAEYSYQKALGRFSGSFDIENIVGTTSDQQIASFWMYLNFLTLIPCLIFLVCLLLVRKKNNPAGIKQFALTLLFFVFFFGGLAYFNDLLVERKFPMVSLNAFCRTSAEFLVTDIVSGGKFTGQLTGKSALRRSVAKPSLNENYRPSNNIVLVVDESVMGDHLSLNGYARKTTPFLENLAAQGVLKNWGLAVSSSTGSRFSYNIIITGLTPDDFPERTEFKISSFPTIFQYAKAMNYTTHYFDGQMKNYWAGIEDDKNYIDDWKGVNNFITSIPTKNWEIDVQIARRIKEIISTSSGNFIFVFKHGSHTPYDDNFPADEEIWKPSYTAADEDYDMPSPDRLPEVVNAYDNCLKYTVDSFFKNLVDDYSRIPNNSVILYTGDHGQTLFVNGQASHGGKTKAEATVPLFVIGKLDAKVDTGYKAAHQNLYPTLLDLMNYPEQLRERKNVPSLLKAKSSDSKPRFFSPNLDSKIPFD